MLKRHIKPLVEKALARSPVILINGARQVGKTTFVLEISKEKGYSYITFDDEVMYLAAKQSSSAFLDGLEKPIIIDEVQRVPEIFLAIKKDVDENRIPGRYILTGSANPLLLPRLGDSLAGRMEIIDLMPLSQGEIYNKEEKFIDSVFSNEVLRAPQVSIAKEELLKRILIGGYPLVYNKNDDDRYAWFNSYMNLLLQRDVKDIAQVEKLTEFPLLLKILATRIAGLMNVADVGREIKMNSVTLNRYLALLETIFLIWKQPAWSANLKVRFTRSPKLSFIDTGLVAYLLAFDSERAFKDPVQMGKMLENFVVSELRKQATWSIKPPSFYHLRTADGEEVDIVLENRSGQVVGIEIKSSTTVIPADTKGLTYLKEKVGDNFLRGIVLYTGSDYIPFASNICALPVNSLWELE
jgi:predicted AAA+ superfamily ATPase